MGILIALTVVLLCVVYLFYGALVALLWRELAKEELYKRGGLWRVSYSTRRIRLAIWAFWPIWLAIVVLVFVSWGAYKFFLSCRRGNPLLYVKGGVNSIIGPPPAKGSPPR